MADGYVQKVASFLGEEGITAVRSWVNSSAPFISAGNNDIINLRYVKRIKRIWRLRDHLLKLSMQCFRVAFIFFILWLMITGYLIMIGIR